MAGEDDKIENILLVDDDANIRLIIKVAIERQTDWKVTSAESGSEALLLMEQSKPDLVLLDIMMPDIDGPMIFEEIKKRFDAAVPVIFLTAKVQNQEVHRFKSLGAKGLITKPFDPITLVQQIKKIVGRS